jgi:hypothetical protein
MSRSRHRSSRSAKRIPQAEFSEGVYTDKAYDALSVEKVIKAKGGTSQLMRKGHRWLKVKAREAHNRPLRPERKNLWHLETRLSFSFDALGWAF